MKLALARGRRWRRLAVRTTAAKGAILCAALMALALTLAGPGAAQEPGGVAYSIELTGTVDPASAAWLDEALSDAERAGGEVALVRLDTPGGLDTAMRDMVQRVIAADLPVIVYVSPDGARAASAGLFVTMAADVAAMAPQTNIGSATPVQLGPAPDDEVLGHKVRNDAAAYVRALADGHGRNADLAERMVRGAVNVPAEHALASNLIDATAASERQLLAELDGFRVQGPKAQTLDTADLRIERHDTPFLHELRQLLVNPTVAFLLVLAGLAGLALELSSPGTIGPGAVGAVSLLLGLYGTVQLPVTLVGILLILLAVGLFIAETQLASGGILGGAGVGALIAGGLFLFDTDSPVFDVSVPATVAGGAVLGAFTLFAASKALSARGAAPRGELEQLLGAAGSVSTPLDPVGQIFIRGAIWRARAANDERLEHGERAVVESVDGLTLGVRRAGVSERPSDGDASGNPPQPHEGSSS